MKRRSGFTLVELLVASSMLAVLGLAGYSVFAASVRSGQKARRVGAMVANGQRALAGIVRDLRALVVHDGTGLTSLDATTEGRSTDTLDFIALRTRGEPEPGTAGRCEVGYYIDVDPDTEAEWLVRREDAAPDDEPLSGGQATPAGPGVAELDLQFYDGTLWSDGWSENSLPRLVKVGIVVTDTEREEEPLYLETTVALPRVEQTEAE
ncbi:MAG: prepilin-type N-terminal cleavage/methylation domain-containing protein [Candidatus Brocadiia bacterium]